MADPEIVTVGFWHPLLGDCVMSVEKDSAVHRLIELNPPVLTLYHELMGGSVLKPRLDHYIGRAFEEVISNEDGEGSEWGIKLTDGVIIRNKDPEKIEIPNPSALEGTFFLMVTLGELDTVMHFGTVNNGVPNFTAEINLTPTLYTLADPLKYGEAEVYSQVADPEETITPDDPSPERVVDGPEKPVEDDDA